MTDNGATLMVAPTPDGTYPVKFEYVATVPSLTTAAPTNWLLTKHPDVYLYGSLKASAPYLRDDPRVQMWGNELEQAIEEARLATDREKYGNTLVMRPRRAIG